MITRNHTSKIQCFALFFVVMSLTLNLIAAESEPRVAILLIDTDRVTGKINEAITDTERLVNAFPDEAQYAMAFAELLSQNNQKARAIQLLEKFNKNNPGNGNLAMLLAA